MKRQQQYPTRNAATERAINGASRNSAAKATIGAPSSSVKERPGSSVGSAFDDVRAIVARQKGA